MNEEKVREKVKEIMEGIKELLIQDKVVMPSSLILCENAYVLLPDEFNNWPEKRTYYDGIKKAIKEFNAIGIIYITDMSFEGSDSHLPLAHESNIGEALLFTASMPSCCLHIAQPYSRLDDKIVFGHEIIWEPEEGQGTAYTKAFMEVWDDDSNFDESKLPLN
jgi:hypothetical protein